MGWEKIHPEQGAGWKQNLKKKKRPINSIPYKIRKNKNKM